MLETHMVLAFVLALHAVLAGELDNGDASNWWSPNRPCAEAMLREVGFREHLHQAVRLALQVWHVPCSMVARRVPTSETAATSQIRGFYELRHTEWRPSVN